MGVKGEADASRSRMERSGRGRASSRLWPWFFSFLKPEVLAQVATGKLLGMGLISESEAALERLSLRKWHSIVLCS